MNDGMNIAFFGSSIVSAYWNGAATYYRGIIKELAANGHKVSFYEPEAYNRQEHKDFVNIDFVKSVIYKADNDDVERVIKQASDADIIIKASGVGVYDSFLEQKLLNYQTTNKAILFWDVDAPATLDRIENDQLDQFRNLIKMYDAILTYGGGQNVIDTYKKYGAIKCFPVYNALDPETHFPVPSDPRFEGTLGFLGNRLPDREERVKEYFFKPALKLKDKLFLLGGNGWETDTEKMVNVRKTGHVYTHEHNSFNCSVLAVLNVNRNSMASCGFSPPTRIFEAAGAGACIITDKWKGVETFLEPGRECLVAENGDEVAQYLKDLTLTDARQIGKAARERVLSEHTYRHRAQLVEKVLENCKETNREAVQ